MPIKQGCSQGKLIFRAFFRHRLGVIGISIIGVLILLVVCAGFIAPYDYSEQFRGHSYISPMRIHWDGFRPYVYEMERHFDAETYQMCYTECMDEKHYLRFFSGGRLFACDAPVFLLGSDKFGRDLFSRILYGGRVSMFVGPLVVLISFPIAILFGGISGYFGGIVDTILQRVGEMFMAIPRLPLMLVIGAAMASMGLSPALTLFGIIAALSAIGWAGNARVIRGRVLSIREMDFVSGAKAIGCNHLRIIARHISPNLASYLIVAATLTIPGMMLAEANLSFLGFGIQEPATSWGHLLNAAMDISTFTRYTWLLIPGFFIITSVLAFNLVGDALRDAFDPFSVKR